MTRDRYALARYRLEGKTPVAEPDLQSWARWFETADRHVSRTDVGRLYVSTVFLGFDHGFGDGPPLLFETMVFAGPGVGDGSGDICQDRCGTWAEAEAMHARAVLWAEKRWAEIARLSGEREKAR